jgi:ribosomal protein S3AE
MAKPTRKEAKVVIRRKKFINVEIPLTKSNFEIIGNIPKDVEGNHITLDLTRQLKGKSVTALFEIQLKDEKPVAFPKKITLMPYFIRRMIRKKISYVEDSFITPTQNSMIRIKPFLITRNKVSRVVRKALRNRCKNWIEDYVSQKTDEELFKEILSNRLQKPLSLSLKKTYPLSLCEIRILEIKRPLKEDEIPELKEIQEPVASKKPAIEKGIDQMAEIEAENAKKEAELEIKETQDKASKVEDKDKKKKEKAEKKEDKEDKDKKKEDKKKEDKKKEDKEDKKKSTKKADKKEKKK